MKGGKEVGGGGEASTARAATGIERSSLPWRSARLPYLAGGSPHGRIERRRDVDTQEVACRSSIRHPGEEGDEEVVVGGTVARRRPGPHRSAPDPPPQKEGGSGTGETAGTSGAKGAGVGREEGGWDGGEERDTWGWERGEPGTLNGDGVSKLCEVLQLSKFPHFEGEGGNGGRAVDGLILIPYVPPASYVMHTKKIFCCHQVAYKG
jgi:hypothetical protein